MKLGTIKVVTCAAAAALLVAVGGGCSTMEKIGLGHGTEAATADAINAQQANSQQQPGETGTGKQIGQAAGQEMFKKVPYLGSSLGGALGSGVEHTMHSKPAAQPAAQQQPAAQPAQVPVQPVAQPAQP
jgi:hypothetical protein